MTACEVAYVRTEDDLRRAAEFQMQALKISADHFDLGQFGEAARMANALFLLIGKGMSSHTSILHAAGQAENRMYRSTKANDDQAGCALFHLRLTKLGENEWDASLQHAGRGALRYGRDLTLDDWWNETVIANDAIKLTRNEIVRILRDKNGGAHFDPVVSDANIAKALKGDLGVFEFLEPDGSRGSIPLGLEYCMRQIAVEFWYSFAADKTFDVAYSNDCARVENA